MWTLTSETQSPRESSSNGNLCRFPEMLHLPKQDKHLIPFMSHLHLIPFILLCLHRMINICCIMLSRNFQYPELLLSDLVCLQIVFIMSFVFSLYQVFASWRSNSMEEPLLPCKIDVKEGHPKFPVCTIFTFHIL